MIGSFRAMAIYLNLYGCSKEGLGWGNSVYRAFFHASGTIGAKLGVNNVYAFAFGDSFHRADWFTSTARDTFIGNNMRHC